VKLARKARSLASMGPLLLAACRTTPSTDAAKPADAAGTAAAGAAVATVPVSAVDAANVQMNIAPDAALAAGLANLASSAVTLPLDGGASSCRRIYGPARVPFDGPAVLDVRGDVLDLVTNDHGRPRVTALPIAPIPPVGKASPATPIGLGSPAVVTHPRCAIAGDVTYCVGGGSILARYDAHGARSEIGHVASTRGIAAATLGADHAHTVVAYMESRKTTEGLVSEAFVAVDGKLPVRLSEEGSGATALDLATRGDDVVALYLDARTAMTPVHARIIHLDMAAETAVRFGDDTVVYIGPLGMPGTVPVLGSIDGQMDALLAWPREAAGFGMTAIPLPDPLKVDLDATWSMYPNGLDPAPIAVAHPRPGAAANKKMHIARVVPLLAAPHSPFVLELGEVGDHGVFTSLGAITTGATVADLSLAEDARGGTWILWSDADSTWLERRICP
jgi:hypothetical protein